MYTVKVVSISGTEHMFTYNDEEAYQNAIKFITEEAQNLTLISATVKIEEPSADV